MNNLRLVQVLSVFVLAVAAAAPGQAQDEGPGMCDRNTYQCTLNQGSGCTITCSDPAQYACCQIGESQPTCVCLKKD